MATCVQSSYSNDPGTGYAGMLADVGPHDVASANNSSSTSVAAGLVVLRSGERLIRPILSSDEPTADPDAILASGIASATTRQTVTGASLNGIIGAGEISPPRNLTITFGSHSDWNDTVLVIQGLDWKGMPIEETFIVKEGGNEVLTGIYHFSYVTAVIIPAATSTNGTILVGVGASIGPLNKLVGGISLYNMAREPGAYAQYESLDVVRQGRVKVSAEAAVTRDAPVFVRIVATGGEVRGAMRATADSNDCALLLGARFVEATSGAGIAIVELNLPT